MRLRFCPWTLWPGSQSDIAMKTLSSITWKFSYPGSRVQLFPSRAEQSDVWSVKASLLHTSFRVFLWPFNKQSQSIPGPWPMLGLFQSSCFEVIALFLQQEYPLLNNRHKGCPARTTTTTTTLYISPHNIQEIKNFITAVQTMIGALAARNNLRVKNARQPVKRKDV